MMGDNNGRQQPLYTRRFLFRELGRKLSGTCAVLIYRRGVSKRGQTRLSRCRQRQSYRTHGGCMLLSAVLSSSRAGEVASKSHSRSRCPVSPPRSAHRWCYSKMSEKHPPEPSAFSAAAMTGSLMPFAHDTGWILVGIWKRLASLAIPPQARRLQNRPGCLFPPSQWLKLAALPALCCSNAG